MDSIAFYIEKIQINADPPGQKQTTMYLKMQQLNSPCTRRNIGAESFSLS